MSTRQPRRRRGGRAALTILGVLAAAGLGAGAAVVDLTPDAGEPDAVARSTVAPTSASTGAATATASSRASAPAPAATVPSTSAARPTSTSASPTVLPASPRRSQSRASSSAPRRRTLSAPPPVRVRGFDADRPVVARGRYGALRIGMTYEQALATGWIDRSSRRPQRPSKLGPCPDLYRDVHGGVVVQLSRTEGLRGFEFEPRTRTPEGLRSGYSWAAANRLYAAQGGFVIPASGAYAWVEDPRQRADVYVSVRSRTGAPSIDGDAVIDRVMVLARGGCPL